MRRTFFFAPTLCATLAICACSGGQTEQTNANAASGPAATPATANAAATPATQSPQVVTATVEEASLGAGGAGEALVRLDIAEGFRMLTRLLRGSLEGRLEYGDPEHPALICTCHETIKIVAENPDNLYLGSSISGKYDYRVWGTRGDARWISFNTFNAGGFAGKGGRGVGSTLHEYQLDIALDGTFEIILSQREHPGNWLPLEPDSTSLTVRQTFLRKGLATDVLTRLRRGHWSVQGELDLHRHTRDEAREAHRVHAVVHPVGDRADYLDRVSAGRARHPGCVELLSGQLIPSQPEVVRHVRDSRPLEL